MNGNALDQEPAHQGNFPGGPVAKTPHLARVPSQVRN